MLGRSLPAATPAALVPTLVSTLVAVVGAWWLWPTFTGDDDAVDVLVVGDGMLAEARRSIELRVREEGLVVEWYESSGWCDELDTLADAVGAIEPRRVVVTFADDDACVDAAAAAIGSAGGVAVVAPDGGPDPAAVTAAGFDTIDPTRLIGAPGGTVVLPCEWWELPCEPAGTAVREADGRLTEAGAGRLARMVAGGL